MTDRLRAIEGLALVAALTAVFDGVHALGDQFVNAAKAVSTFVGVSLPRGN
jgi:small basic protein